MNRSILHELQTLFGDNLHQNVRLCNYTTARIGGPALGLVPINTVDEMKNAANSLWNLDVKFKVLGSGSNILISDHGYDGVILLNHCHNIKIFSQEESPSIYAESGGNLSNVARQSALRGLSGLEWASSVPGSIGGAIYGNAGAFGADISDSLRSVDILYRYQGEKKLTVDMLRYTYRSSILKKEKPEMVILSSIFNATKSSREEAWTKLTKNIEKRQATQPTGASFGSTFKNPAGEKAGQLLEAVGLKGYSEGHARFSPLHANFIINDGNSSANEYMKLIKLAQNKVLEQFGIQLELEIELLGNFDDE